MINISNVAVIARPMLTAWNGEVMDRVAANKLDGVQHAVTGVHKVKKVLLPNGTGTELRMLWEMMNDLRAFGYFHSLRWINKGEVLVPIPMLPTFQQGAGDREVKLEEFFSKVLLPAYPTRVREAATMLGTGYNADEYPSVDELRRRFKINVSRSIMPVPDHNKLQDLVSMDAAANAEAMIAKGVQDAMRDAYERIYDVVKHAKDKLSDDKAIFRDSLVENMRKLAKVLPGLNVTDDPLLNEVSSMLASLGSTPPEALRDFSYQRSDAVRKANALLSKLGQAGIAFN